MAIKNTIEYKEMTQESKKKATKGINSVGVSASFATFKCTKLTESGAINPISE